MLYTLHWTRPNGQIITGTITFNEEDTFFGIKLYNNNRWLATAHHSLYEGDLYRVTLQS